MKPSLFKTAAVALFCVLVSFHGMTWADDGRHGYDGPLIKLDGKKHSFTSRVICNFTPNQGNNQGGALYGNYIFMGNSRNSTILIYDISTGKQVGTMECPVVLHHNTMAFGIEGNGQFPYLYCSEWDGQHRICAFSITKDGDKWGMKLVQTIYTNNVSAARMGKGNLDFAIDEDNDRLILIAYTKVDGSDHVGNNSQYSIVRRMPQIADGATVNISDDDITETFTLDVTEFRQDCLYNNGKLFITAGVPGWGLDRSLLYVVNLEKHCYDNIIDLKQVDSDEPETLELYDGGFLYIPIHGAAYKLTF
ncbi:MAG: hypothetical protein KBT10_09040 [Bacteroidales bacterium]|nr:hypothetical protein [Candidatus Sodaliphilus aphodohippi]